MEMIEVTAKIMKADGMSEAAEDLGKAIMAIEDAWAKVAVSALADPEGEGELLGIEGGMQASVTATSTLQRTVARSTTRDDDLRREHEA
jgi:hypothetical protein